jgi:aldehyde dehydrogenase (NAD+)
VDAGLAQQLRDAPVQTVMPATIEETKNEVLRMTALTERANGLFIGGKWRSGAPEARLDVVSPFTQDVIAHAPGATSADMDDAVAAARDSFESGVWAKSPVAERAEIVATLGRLIAEQSEEIAELITNEMGCPITQSRGVQAVQPTRLIEAYLQIAEEYPFEEVRRAPTGSALVTREPVGVVAAIVPWNVPMGISIQKLVPALLAGCSVILKPAPQTALDGLVLAEMLERAGVPAGVVSVVPADREASEHLVQHPGVDKVGFTGSTAAGRRIAAICGNDLRRVTLELGGKSAALVLDDADFASVAEALRLGSFRNNGQICTLKTRILVPRRREGEFIDALSAAVASMPVGDPADPSTEIGPLVTDVQRERVERYIASGVAEGANLVMGGGRPAGLDLGWFVEPTIFSAVTPKMTIAKEEIFGPVVAVMPYDDEADAVLVANDTPYGLHGAVFTADLDRGLRVARGLRTGAVELNGSPIGLRAPFGGFKSSGIGRENGIEGIDSYTEARSIGLPPDYADRLAGDA